MQISWIDVYTFESSITSNFGEGVEHGPHFRKIQLRSRMGYLIYLGLKIAGLSPSAANDYN